MSEYFPCTGTAPIDCVGILDCSALNVRVFVRNPDGSDGAQVTAPEACGEQYNLYVDWVDCEGSYMGDNVPVNGRLDVTNGVGSEVFDLYDGNITNKYIFTTPNSSTATQSQFQLGQLDPDGNLVTCTFSINLLACDIEATKTLDIPAVADSNVTETDIDGWMGGDLRFFIREENTAVVLDANGDPCWVNNHVPDGSGSAAILGVCNLPDEDCYTVEETITLSNNFDFGNGSIGIKVGAGITGGNNGAGGLVTGGSTATTGFTARPTIVADANGNPCFAGYLYYANRPGMPSGGTVFGDEVKTGVIPVPGGTYNIRHQVCKNDPGQNNGTYAMWIDGAQVINMGGIRWMDGTPVIDGMVFSSFHGGSTSAFDPNTTVQVTYKDISVTTP